MTEITLATIKSAFEKYCKDSHLSSDVEWKMFKRYILHEFKEKSLRGYVRARSGADEIK